MVQAIPAEKVTLYDLEQTYGLQQVSDPTFFQEWQDDLPDLSPEEERRLERARLQFLHLSKLPLLEEMVKLVIVAPLLDLAGFYNPPFYSRSEQPIQLSLSDQEIVIRGKIDILVVQAQLWLLVIESKQAGFSLAPGIPQALAYMLASPDTHKPLYGLVTNGSNFVFLKLTRDPQPVYAKSKEFILDQDKGLEQTLRIMKRLGAIIS